MKTAGLLAALATLTTLPASAQTPVMTGTWELTWESPRRTITQTLVLHQDGNTFAGTATFSGGRAGGGGGGGGMGVRGRELEVQDGTIDGHDIAFVIVMGRGDQTFELTFTGTVDGDTASGTVQTPRGDDREWTAKRVEGSR